VTQSVFAAVIVVLGLVGAGVFLPDVSRRGPLMLLRLFAGLICVALAVVYGLHLLGVLDSVTLPPVARPLVGAALSVLIGFGIVLRGR
jgi:hypothetical protein